jgi:hypothetical protein
MCRGSLFYVTTVVCPFILIHPAVLNCPEIQTNYEEKQTTLIIYTNLLRVAARQNHQQATLLRKFTKDIITLAPCN